MQVRYRRIALAAVAISSLAVWAGTGVSFDDDAGGGDVEAASAGEVEAARATDSAGPPCLGCVGGADDNDPTGQAKGDDNAGHECDVQGEPDGGNPGIGDGNPAHTGDCEPKTDPETCPDGKAPAEDGSCAQPPHRCPDGSEPPADGSDCPAECPDGSAFCTTIDPGVTTPRSCPVNLPLPTGGSCPTPTTQPPAPAANASVGPAVQGSVFGRPTEVLGVQQTRASAPLARTGDASRGLIPLGFSLTVVGAALLRLARYRPYVPQHR